MKTKFTVELECDAVDKIVADALKSAIEGLEVDLELRKKGDGMAIFHKDKKKDIAEINQHIDAFWTVLNYYGKEV